MKTKTDTNKKAVEEKPKVEIIGTPNKEAVRALHTWMLTYHEVPTYEASVTQKDEGKNATNNFETK